MAKLKLRAKIGVALFSIILFLPVMVNAEETEKFTLNEINDLYGQGWKASTEIWFDFATQDLLNGYVEGIVGENILFKGAVFVILTKNNQEIRGPLINPRDGSFYNFYIQVYKEGAVVDDIMVWPDSDGNFSASFTPKESGYYMIDWTSGNDWVPMDSFYKTQWEDKRYFYVSEKDSDSDGVPDQYDYGPYDPDVQSRSDIKMPGFEAGLAISGLLAAALLFRRRR